MVHSPPRSHPDRGAVRRRGICCLRAVPSARLVFSPTQPSKEAPRAKRNKKPEARKLNTRTLENQPQGCGTQSRFRGARLSHPPPTLRNRKPAQLFLHFCELKESLGLPIAWSHLRSCEVSRSGLRVANVMKTADKPSHFIGAPCLLLTGFGSGRLPSGLSFFDPLHLLQEVIRFLSLFCPPFATGCLWSITAPE